MNNKHDSWFLIAVLVFGVLGICVGGRWIAEGSIVIRKGGTRVGRAATPPRPAPKGAVAGTIESSDLLFYPICLAWISLGLTMLTMLSLAIFTRNLIFYRLAAYSLASVLVLGFSTVAAALWYGP
jgi:hypothetical protein